MAVKDTLKKILLWIISIPTFLLAQSILIFFSQTSCRSIYQDSLCSTISGRSFNGHFLVGPMYLFSSYLFSIYISLYFVVKLFDKYPKHGKAFFWLIAIFFLFISVSLILMSLFVSHYPLETRAKYIIDAAAVIFGIYLTGESLGFIKTPRHSHL